MKKEYRSDEKIKKTIYTEFLTEPTEITFKTVDVFGTTKYDTKCNYFYSFPWYKDTTQIKEPIEPKTPIIRSVRGEPSKFGAFEFAQIDDSCMITFNHTNGNKYEVIKNGYCSEDNSNRIIPTNKIRANKLPAMDECGNELHIFETLTAGGGNACGGNSYWVVYVKKEGLWASEQFGGCAYINSITKKPGDSNCLITVTMSSNDKFLVKYGLLSQVNAVSIPLK